MQTGVVEDLSHLPGVPGTGDAVALASTAESEDQARFLADTVDMLATYHQSHTPHCPGYDSRSRSRGRDRGAGSDRLRVLEQAHLVLCQPSDLAAPKRGVWLSGQISPLAKKIVEVLGWVIKERTKL